MLRDPGVGWSNRGWGARGARRPRWAWRSPLSRGARSSILARAPWGPLWPCNGTRGMGGYSGGREPRAVAGGQDTAAWALG